MTPRDRRRAKRIQTDVPLADVLRRYHYVIDESHREQQFRCDLHGKDNKPSARFYPASNSTYCWVCHRARNPIDYVKEKENVGFGRAMEFLESWFRLPPLPWEDGDDGQREIPVFEIKDRTPLEALESCLMISTRNHLLTMNQALKLWDVFDVLSHTQNQKKAEEVLSAAYSLIWKNSTSTEP